MRAETTAKKLRSRGRLARFVSPEHEDGVKIARLSPDHPAVLNATTIFTSRVKPVAGAKNILVDGINNPKIGRIIEKGAWAGMPVFTLTLEERATCPRSCDQWLSCYGGSMHHPTRWDHTDPTFLEALAAEVTALALRNPGGFVVRLHVLGDFFSMEYLEFWVRAIDYFPQLHIYGYTARRNDMDSEESRAIAAGIFRVADAAWDQFAIRFSFPSKGPQRAIVVDKDPHDSDVIMCPAQTQSTETCGTCGLCWSPAMRQKTIGFLRHGKKAAMNTQQPPRFGSPRAGYITGALRAPSPTKLKEDDLEPTMPMEDAETYNCKWPYGEKQCCGRRTAFRKSYCDHHLARVKQK